MDNAYEGVMQWISQARAAGLSDIQITEQLKAQGWQADQVQKILAPVAQPPSVAPKAVPTPTQTESVRTEIQQAFDPNVKPKGKFWPVRHLVLLASVLGGLIIVGGVAFAGWKGYIPIPFLGNDSEKIMAKAIQSFSNIKNAEIGINFRVAAEPKNPNYQNPTAPNKNSAIDLTNNLPPDLIVEGNLSVFGNNNNATNVNGLLDQGSGILKINGSYSASGQKMSLDAELRIIQKKIYLILNQAPELPFFDISAFKGQWFYVDSSLTQDYLNGSSFENATQDVSDPQKVTKLKNEAGILARIALKTKALELKKLDTDAIDGQTVQKIQVILNPANYAAMAQSYRADAKARNVKSDEIESLLKDLTSQNINEVENTVKQVSLVVWLGKSDYTPRKLEVSAVAVPADPSEALKNKQFNLKFTITLDHINQQPTVELPADAKSLMDVIGPILESPLSQARDTQRKSDLSLLQTALSSYYDKLQKFPNSLDELLAVPEVWGGRLINKLPSPPTSSEKYTYTLNTNKTDYTICATLENGDPENLVYCMNKSGPISVPTETQP